MPYGVFLFNIKQECITFSNHVLNKYIHNCIKTEESSKITHNMDGSNESSQTQEEIKPNSNEDFIQLDILNQIILLDRESEGIEE